MHQVKKMLALWFLLIHVRNIWIHLFSVSCGTYWITRDLVRSDHNLHREVVHVCGKIILSLLLWQILSPAQDVSMWSYRHSRMWHFASMGSVNSVKELCYIIIYIYIYLLVMCRCVLLESVWQWTKVSRTNTKYLCVHCWTLLLCFAKYQSCQILLHS